MEKTKRTSFLQIAKSFVYKLENNPSFESRCFESEQKKLGLIRLLVGVILAHRYAYILEASSFFHDSALPSLLASVILINTLMVAIGLFTSLSLLLLSISLVFIDGFLGTYNLGTAVFSTILFILLFSDPGKHYSLDSRFSNSSVISKINSILSKFSVKDSRSLAQLYTYAFSIFSIVNLAAFAGHLLDPYWLSGEVMLLSLKNPFYSRFFDFFRSLDHSNPLIYRLICYPGEIFQLIFQLAMLPLSYFFLGRLFVIIWGAIFFIFSFILFQLSYLTYFEILLWIILFFNLRKQDKEKDIEKMKQLNLFKYLANLSLVAFVLATIITTYYIAKDRAKHPAAPSMARVKKELPYFATASFHFSRLVGFITPNVFNSPDIRAASLYIKVTRQKDSSAEELIPFVGEQGERLSYHKSDLIYYKVSIPLRRCIQGKDISQCFPLMKSIANYDYRKQKLENIYTYRFYQIDKEEDSIKLVNTLKLRL